MNIEKEKFWKKISKTELKLGERISDEPELFSKDEQAMISDLQDRLDDTFKLFDIKTVVEPNNFERVIIARLVRTEKK